MKFQLATPVPVRTIYTDALLPVLAFLPSKMGSVEAKIQVLAHGYQESKFKTRVQDAGGPARSFYQMEKGGGIKGVLSHPASADLASMLCGLRKVAPTADAVYDAFLEDDILATGLARLLIWTDPKKLPFVGDVDGAWDLYNRVWRPGHPRRETWLDSYTRARSALGV